MVPCVGAGVGARVYALHTRIRVYLFFVIVIGDRAILEHLLNFFFML
jgi:hypothetical protein